MSDVQRFTVVATCSASGYTSERYFDTRAEAELVALAAPELIPERHKHSGQDCVGRTSCFVRESVLSP